MEFWGSVRRLERTISNRVDDMVRRGPQPAVREPLAVMLAIVDAVEQQVQHAGRGRRVFPFNRLRVTIVAAGRDERAHFTAVFDEEPTLDQRIAERLSACGCDTARLVTRTGYVAAPAEGWADPQFHLEFARVAAVAEEEPPPQTAPATPAGGRIKLAVAGGAAERDAYSFTEERINIGRCAQVLDRRLRLIRINHVAFRDDAGPSNAGVSRRHAHIVRDAAGVYHVIDDHSARGTYLLRRGRTIDVPAGGRGLRLQPGDELVLGGARLAVDIREA